MKLVFYFPSLASARPGPASWFLDAINIDFPLLPRHWSPHRTCTLGMSKYQVLAFDFFILSFHLQRLQNGQENTQDIYCFIVFDSRSGAAWLVISIMCCTTLFHRRSILVQNYATLQHDKNIIFEIILYCAGICSTNCQSLLQLSSWDTCWPCLVSRTSSHAYKHIIFQAVACPAVRRERRHQPGPAVSCQTGYLSLALTRAQADREGRVSDWVVETLETVMSSGDTSQ